MSECDDARPIGEAIDALRARVPVREEWRAGLLAAVADEPRPRRERRIVLHPLAGIAAALAFTVLGGGVVVGALALRGERASLGTTAAAVAPSRMQVIEFELIAPNASRVSLVGDFNRWDPDAIPLSAEGRDGRWRVTVPLEPGRHLYSFIVDGDLTPDPTAPRAADDDFGTPNSVVVVSGPST